MEFEIRSIKYRGWNGNSLGLDEHYPCLKDYRYSSDSIFHPGTVTVDSLEQLLELMDALDNEIIIQKRLIDVYDPAAGCVFLLTIYDDYIE